MFSHTYDITSFMFSLEFSFIGLSHYYIALINTCDLLWLASCLIILDRLWPLNVWGDCLLLRWFTHRATSLLWVWRSRQMTSDSNLYENSCFPPLSDYKITFSNRYHWEFILLSLFRCNNEKLQDGIKMGKKQVIFRKMGKKQVIFSKCNKSAPEFSQRTLATKVFCLQCRPF